MSRAGMFLKRRLWVWPIIAVLLLSTLGFMVRGAIESTMKSNLASELQTLLNVESAMLETWYGVQISNAESLANDMRIRELVYQLLDDQPTPADTQRPQVTPIDQQLQKQLSPAMSSHNYVGYLVTDKSKRILASSHGSLVEQQDVLEYDGFLTRALDDAARHGHQNVES